MGVVFTGSTEVAKVIYRALAGRGAVPLVAETGGQNCMIVDSTALAEQVVADALSSAFDSAGQRCSALRVLCLQEEIADKVFAMLKGAMAELVVGDPSRISTDVGPVIDDDAQLIIDKHIDGMPAATRTQGATIPDTKLGSFVVPALIEIRSISQLQREVFGPVLHVLRFERARLGELVAAINATGYGLTLGIESRIDETVDEIVRNVHVGNTYVNRNIVGAVVGVQPFGGEGLSGTGPKAGGPLYLHRLLRRTPGPRLEGVRSDASAAPLRMLLDWLRADGSAFLPDAKRDVLVERVERYGRESPLDLRIALPGPAGEDNSLSFAPRGTLLGSARSLAVAVHQLGAALATGNRLMLTDPIPATTLPAALPPALREWLIPEGSERGSDPYFPEKGSVPFREPLGAALFEDEGAGTAGVLEALRERLANRPGPIVSIVTASPDYNLEQLVVERTLSINTTAAGGNTHLMTLAS